MFHMANPGPNKLYINPQTNLSPYRSRSEPKPNEVRVARPFASNLSACPLITSPWQSTKKDHSVFFLCLGLGKDFILCHHAPHARTPDKSRSQTFNLSHSAFACLPACASYNRSLLLFVY